MAILYLMRHGAAEDVAPSGRDADRSLTPAGRTAVRRVGLALRDLRTEPIGRIISSPLARAQQTAEIMGAILCADLDSDRGSRPSSKPHDVGAGGPSDRPSWPSSPDLGLDIELEEDLSPEGSAYGLAVRIASGAQDTLLVGHQPNIEMVARALARRAPSSPGGPASSLRLPNGFRTALLVGFSIEGAGPPYPLAVVLDPTELGTG